MQPFLMRSDFDPFQVTVIVIFVLASFIKWLWENWQAKNSGADYQEPPDPEEARLREAAWRRQTGQSTPPPLPPPVAPSPWREVKKVWEELQDSTRASSAPAKVRRTVRSESRLSVPESSSPAAQVAAAPVAAARALPRHEAPPSEPRSKPSPLLAVARRMRGDSALMRQAVLMHEILGPPKALQSSNDPAI
ncbi:MAG: hypothetical protein R3F13_03675 [Prosthecobacter sp.]